MLELNKLNLDGVVEAEQTNGLVARFHEILSGQRIRLQNLSVLVLVNFFAMGLAFLTNVKIANVMGKEGFGQLAYGLALGTCGAVIVRFGLNRTLVRDLVHYPNRFEDLLAASLVLRAIVLGLVLFALITCKVLTPVEKTLSWGVMAIIASRCLVSMDLQSVYDAWQKMQRHALYNLVQRSFYFGLIWLVVLLFPEKLTINWIALASVSAVILYLVIQHRWAAKQLAFDNVRTSLWKNVSSMAKQNSWVWLGSIAVLSFGYLNQLILKHFHGTAELGGYAAAWLIVSAGMLLMAQVSRIGKPVTARITRKGTDKTKRIRFLLKYTAVMLIVAGPICIPATIFPELLLRTIFRPEYASEAQIMRIMGIYLMIYCFGLVASQYIVSARMEKTYFASVILGGCLSVILCFVLIPKLSGLGAALALLIAHGTSMTLYFLAMIKDVKLRES